MFGQLNAGSSQRRVHVGARLPVGGRLEAAAGQVCLQPVEITRGTRGHVGLIVGAQARDQVASSRGDKAGVLIDEQGPGGEGGERQRGQYEAEHADSHEQRVVGKHRVETEHGEECNCAAERNEQALF